MHEVNCNKPKGMDWSVEGGISFLDFIMVLVLNRPYGNADEDGFRGSSALISLVQ